MFRVMKKMIAVIMIISIIIAAMSLTANAAGFYTVKSGDTLWKISKEYGLTVAQLKEYNSLTNDTIYVGQKLNVVSQEVNYTVKSGDTLWKIANAYHVTVTQLKSYNALTSDTIYVNQILKIPTEPSNINLSKPTPVTSWPSITYVVQPGDTLSAIAKKFGVSQADLMKYNYMEAGEWLDAGEKIAISGYAPRNYAIMPGESTAPAKVGKLVDWFLDGQYLIKRNDVFTVTDVATGLQFNVKMLGGVNHPDVEPLTASDTATMKKLFPTWVWNPRAVVIFHDGINFAASLSGMPHSYDFTPDNNVTGHFDLYLYNSIGHNSTETTTYTQQHNSCILVAAGLK